MRLQMRGRRSDWTEPLRQHAERRLHFALSRFTRSVGLVTVDLRTVAGAPGRLDKTCRIAANLSPKGRILIEATHIDPFAAINRAAEVAGRAVGRALERERERNAGPTRSTAMGGPSL